MLLVILLLSSLLVLTVTPVNVQAVSKPSVPQIVSIKVLGTFHDVPPSTTIAIDQFTGKEITITTPGYREDNRRIEITIKNQPFTHAGNSRLYYGVQVKGPFGGDNDWGHLSLSGSETGYIMQWDSGNTVLTAYVGYDPGVQLYVRVQAVVGYWFRLPVEHIVVEVESDWSKVQTVTMPGGTSSTPSQTTLPTNPTVSPDNNQTQYPEQTQPPSFVFHQTFLLWLGALLFAGVAIAVVVMFTKKHLKTPNYNNPATTNNYTAYLFQIP